jgi:asparaginyl-tRNA synthetase
LIFPQIGEIIGGSLREHDLASIEKEMALRGMKSSEMDWYLSTRVNGSVPHGGFGLGMERLISYLSGVENLRDVVPFPRARDECVA